MSASSPDSPQGRATPLHHLARACRALGAESEPGRALAKLLATLREHLAVDRAAVFAVDVRASTIQLLRAVDRTGRHETGGQPFPLEDEPAPVKRVARREVPHFCGDLVSAGVASGLSAHAAVPVVSAGQLLGILAADNRLTGSPMPETVIEPMFLYAGLAANPLYAHSVRQERARVEAMRRAICGEVLFSVTNGKMRLCEPAEIESEWPPMSSALPIRRAEDIRAIREAVRCVGREAGMEGTRVEQFGLCACEAATNALVHGSGGSAALACREGRLRIRVADGGAEIRTEDLPKATLMKGWSSRASMGLGFTIIKESADAVLIATGPAGTTIILEMAVEPAARPLEQFHARLWSEAAPL